LLFLETHAVETWRAHDIDIHPVEGEQVQFLAVELHFLLLHGHQLALEPFAGLELDPVKPVAFGGDRRAPVVGFRRLGRPVRASRQAQQQGEEQPPPRHGNPELVRHGQIQTGRLGGHPDVIGSDFIFGPTVNSETES
jgi:hypothetical protein